MMEHIYLWFKVEIAHGPADHPSGQRNEERARAGILDVVSELCKLWPS